MAGHILLLVSRVRRVFMTSDLLRAPRPELVPVDWKSISQSDNYMEVQGHSLISKFFCTR